MKARDKAMHRAGGRCEAEVEVNGVWTRCFDNDVEVHHKLTRARGGTILDKAGEDYHLVVLCRKHHRQSDGIDAYVGGLLIDGYVVSINGRPKYYGQDEYLKEKYGDT